jgi:hypothetical protein
MKNDLPKRQDGHLMSKQNIKDLERSIALLKEKNKLLEQQLALGKKLSEDDAKRLKFQQDLIKQHTDVIEQYKQENKIRKEGLKELTGQGGVFNDHVRQSTVSGLVSTANSNKGSKQFKSISDWYNTSQLEKQEAEANKIYDKVFKSTYNKYFKEGKDLSDKDVQASLRAEVEAKASKQIGEAAGKYGKASVIIDSASKLFSKAVNTWVGVATAGLKNQTSAYESTFTNVSVRTGTSRGQYQDAQWRTNNDLSALGLRNNVATTEVQQMWNSLASIGADQETMFERAIDNVVTNKIVPYLDTTSLSVNLLNNRLDGKFVKDIRGINEANLQIAGNNYATQELLNTIIDQVQPMSDKALEDLAQGSTEITALIGQLINSGMDPNVAKSYATKYFKMQKYSDQIMRSGTVAEKMTMSNVLGSGLNLYDLKDANNIMGLAVDTEMGLAGNAPGYTNSMTGLSTNIIGSALGLDYDTMSSILNLQAKGLTGSKFASDSDLTNEKLQEYIEIANKAFSGDKNQTQKTLQNVTMENLMNELSVWYERFGNWADLIIDAIKGIGTILTAKVVGGMIGKGIASLVGEGATLNNSAGLGKLLGSAGPLVGGIAAVAAIGAGTNKLISQWANDKGTAGNNNATGFAGDFVVTDSQGNQIGDNVGAGTIASYAQQYGREDGSSKWGGFFKGFGENFVGSVANAFNWNGYDEDNPESYNAEKWKRFMAERNKVYEDTQMQWLISAFATAMLDAGNSADIFSSVFGGSKITTAGLKAFYHAKYQENPEDAQAQLNWAVRTLATWDLYPVGPKRKYSDLSWSGEDMESWGVYRTGLSEVPYDDYPALLHEGEAVLTASTANELRNLITEYRDTTTQAINFDTIVQTQTETLVMKIDEVISTMRTTSGLTSVSSTNPKLNERLTNSMTYMRSTKSF